MTARMWVDLGAEIPMRDGTVLRADVYRAEGDHPLPVLVHQPYQGRRAKESLAVLVNPVTAFDRGYATVLVDARGTGGSDGAWQPFAGQDADGYDTVEWCAAQPWCDGGVGVYGSSGMGVTALRTAIAAPPHLRAAMLAFTGGTYHDGWAYTSGVLELSWAQWWARVMGAGRLARMPAGAERDALAERLDRARDLWPSVRRLPLAGGPVPAELAPWYARLAGPPRLRRLLGVGRLRRTGSPDQGAGAAGRWVPRPVHAGSARRRPRADVTPRPVRTGEQPQCAGTVDALVVHEQRHHVHRLA